MNKYYIEKWFMSKIETAGRWHPCSTFSENDVLRETEKAYYVDLPFKAFVETKRIKCRTWIPKSAVTTERKTDEYDWVEYIPWY